MNYQTHIILAKGIKLDREYQNILNYTEDEMLNLVNTNKINEVTNASFVQPLDKSRAYIDYPLAFTNIMSANYLAFKNINYGNKWFFAFIDDVIYDNDGTARIRYTVDEFSTWFDYWDAEPCFIVREHVNDDTIGLHTVPENLDVGDLICDYYRNDNTVSVDEWFWIVVASNYDPTSGGQWAGFSYHDGYPQGCQWFAFKVSAIVPIDGYNQANAWLASVASADHVADIQGMFVLPRKCDRRFRS